MIVVYDRPLRGPLSHMFTKWVLYRISANELDVMSDKRHRTNAVVLDTIDSADVARFDLQSLGSIMIMAPLFYSDIFGSTLLHYMPQFVLFHDRHSWLANWVC